MRRVREVIKALILVGALGALATTAKAAEYPAAGIAAEVAGAVNYTVAGIAKEVETISVEVIPEEPEVDLDEMVWEYFSDEDVLTLARLVKAEAGGLPSYEQSLVIWTVLNRKDDPAFPDTVQEVILQPNQFANLFGYTPEGHELVLAVLREYVAEHVGLPAARTLPFGYFWFKGDGAHNYFYNDYDEWDRFSQNHL